MDTTMPANSLKIERTIAAARDKVWRCWTEPELLKQWYCPRPWQVVEAELDVRAGGRCFVVMQGPEGQRMPMPGVYLDVMQGSRLVFTDAFESAWLPSGKAFMVGEIRLADTPDGHTHYEAFAHHWNAEDRATHEQMGFHQGWGAAADQLEALAKSL